MVTKPTARRAGRALNLALAAVIAASAASATAAGKWGPPEVTAGNVTKLRGSFMTKGEPATLSLPGGGAVVVYADTEASLLTESQGLMLLPGKKTVTYSVILRKGHIDVELPEQNPPALAVIVSTKADTRIVTLSGKTSIRAEGYNVTAVSYQGLTTVTQGTKLTRLPNKVKRTYQGKSGNVDHDLLAATSYVNGKRVWLATRGTVKASGYTWAPVAKAVGYKLSLEDKLDGRIITQQRVTEPRFEATNVELGPGQYELKVTAIDRDGFFSPQSGNLNLRVVGVKLPPGAELQKNDTIALGSNQQISLSHAEGLTLTTADHRGNVPATSAFGLASQERASILIHDPDGADTSTLTLVRREYLVRVWVGPKLVTWPLEPVELRIELMDEQGNRLAPTVEPAARVLLGTDPVEVDWTKGSSTWHARLSPQSGQGPWVVRLEVLDQYGVLIGRDFVEVSSSALRRKDTDSTNLEPSVEPLPFE
jgi:hypothetical protein